MNFFTHLRLLFLGLCLIVGSFLPLQAQFERVEFDYDNAYFNNGQPLPAEQRMIVTGEIDPSVTMVELSLFREDANQEKAPLFMGTWKRMKDEETSNFRVPVNYKLTGSTPYDFRITYFRNLSTDEKQTLQDELQRAMGAYLEQNVEIGSDKVKLAQSARNIIGDLDDLVNDGLRYYRNLNEVEFSGFSELSEQAIDQLDKLPVARYDSAKSRIKRLLFTELEQVFNTDLVMRTDERQVPGYETERTRRPVALNVGYGGTVLDYGSESFAYDTSPYVGISFPLANPALSGAFWSNASISVGAFTSNFEDSEGNVVTGPIFGRPYYLGVGYNIFRFIRINAGVTALENLGTSSVGNGSVSLDVDAISLQPFIGISAEIEIWAGLRDR